MNDQMKYTLTVDHLHVNMRVDKFMAELLPNLSRSKIQNLIISGSVTTKNGQVHDCAYKVKEHDVYDIIIPEPSPSHLFPNDIPLDILYEDDDLIVVNKQAGLTTHPGAGNNSNTLVNALLAHCGKNLSTIGAEHLRPGIVHRLDKNTSGVMVVAKNDITHTSLALQIQNRELCRQYTAITFGVPKPLSGTIKYNISRSDKDRTKMAVIAIGGKTAVTHYEVLEILSKGLVAVIKCNLETGRTHQIRVHFSHNGYPIIGDQEYGNIRHKKTKAFSQEVQDYLQNFKRQALHSTFIKFTHPITKKNLEFTAPLPDDIAQLINLMKL